MTLFNDLKESFDLAFYKTFNTSLFHPTRHYMLIDKTKEKLAESAEEPPETSEYYIAKLKGSKIKFVKKGDEEDDDEGGSGTGSREGDSGNDEEDQDYFVDKAKEVEDNVEQDPRSHLDRITDQLKERRETEHFTDFVVFEHHIKQIEHIKDNLRKIENIPINEVDPLYLRLAEAMCGSLAEINVTLIDLNQDAYITGVLEFLDVLTNKDNRRELVAINKERFPTLCKEAEKAIPDGFDQEVSHKPSRPGM